MRSLRCFPKVAILVCLTLFPGCRHLSSETFHHLSEEERRTLSAGYTELARKLESGSPEQMRVLEKAIRINPRNDQAYFELAVPYLEAGLYDKWNEYMSKAIRYNPQAWQAMRGYQKLFCLRDYGGALYDLDATDTLTRDQTDFANNMSVDYLRGLCYLGMNDLDRAEQYFLTYIEKEEKDVGMAFVDETAFLYLGMIEGRRGNHDRAIEWYMRSQEFENGSADVHYFLAKSYLAVGSGDLALTEWQKSKQLFDEGDYLRGYRCARPFQLYNSDINALGRRVRAQFSE